MIYFKIVNHSAKTDYEIVRINHLSSDIIKSASFKNDDIILVNNVWYSFEDILKHCGLSSDSITKLNDPSDVQGVYSYLDNSFNKTYTLDYIDVYEVSSKDDTKGTKVRRWTNPKRTEVGYGTYINFHFGGATLNDSRDRFFIVHIGNPLSEPANNPIIKWNGYNGGITNNSKTYDNINNISCVTSNTSINIVFNEDYNNLTIYKNGSLLETKNVKKNEHKVYMLKNNDVLEFKKATETTPPKPTEPPKPTTPPKPTPVYYNLPSVSRVTFNPSKAELGKMTPIKVEVETGYTINNLSFSAENPNTGMEIFTSSYKDGIINLDLTSFDATDKSSADELITVTQNITKIVHKDWLIPSATGITFTAGITPISTVKLGEYTNVILHLDYHYTWNDNQGKGLILNDGTVLGSWNGKNTLTQNNLKPHTGI